MVTERKDKFPTDQELWDVLEQVKDPEIPVVSIVEMGMVRGIIRHERRVIVMLTPTFAGCPALELIQEQTLSALKDAGVAEIDIKLAYSPPWSSDDIQPRARQKLKAFGLAPPREHQGLIQIALQEPVECPLCGSTNTSLKNSFGSTLCRAIYFCDNCQGPFEQFKPL